MLQLPKKKNHKEADVTPLVMRWFEKHYPRSCNVEVKIKGNTLLRHQEGALKKTQAGVFTHKMPDMGMRNPCDFYMIKDGDGVLVTCDGRTCEARVMSGATFIFKV